jgi:hypothetical protein
LSLPVLELPPNDPSSGSADRSGIVGELGLFGEIPRPVPPMPPVVPPIEELPAVPPPAWANKSEAENRTPATADRQVLFMCHPHCAAVLTSYMAGGPRSRQNQATFSVGIARRADLTPAERRQRDAIVRGRMAAPRAKKFREPKKAPAKKPRRLWPSGYQSV